MVKLAQLQSATIHIKIDNLCCSTGQGGDRKATRIGEKIEDFLAGGPFTNQLATNRHVEEKTDILCLT